MSKWGQRYIIVLMVAMWALGLTTGIQAHQEGGRRNERTVSLRIKGHWPCQEDEVIIGVGDYNGRRWTAYRCEAADDL